VAPQRIHFVGNTMIDSLLAFRERAEASTILERLRLRIETNGRRILPYGVLTLHRPSNVDNRDIFMSILGGLKALASEWPIVFPVHPRTGRQIGDLGLEAYLTSAIDGRRGGLVMTEPLGYLDFLCLMKHAAVVITDSGGIQEETTCLGIPCVTVRENTERPVTVTSGTNCIAGTAKEKIEQAIRLQIAENRRPEMPPKWDGGAARRIVGILVKQYVG